MYFAADRVTTITSVGTDYDDEIVVDSSVAANIAIHGGDGNDRLLVSATEATAHFSRKLWGDGGNDFLIGSDFVDELSGGPGDDQLYGMKGNDILNGDGDNDALYGGDGSDVIYGGTGNDVVYAGKDNDWVHGDAGDDRLFGEEGDDWLFGDANADELTGGQGADYLLGGTGSDRIIWDASEPVDAFIAGGNSSTTSDGGTDQLIVTTTAAADTIIVTAIGGLNSVTASDPNPADGASTTLARIGTGVQLQVNAATLVMTDMEALQVNAGAGADVITVNDLKGSLLKAITMDLGLANGSTPTVVPVTRPILIKPAAESGALNFILRGAVTANDTWTISLGNDSYSYTAKAGDDLDKVAIGLRDAIDAGLLYDATSSGNTLSLTRLNAAAVIEKSLFVNTLTISGTSGFFRLNDGSDFADLPWNADDATIQAKLERFDGIGEGHVTVATSTTDATKKTITIIGKSTDLKVEASPALSAANVDGAIITVKDVNDVDRIEAVYAPATDAIGNRRIVSGALSGAEVLEDRIEQRTLLTLSGKANLGNHWTVTLENEFGATVFSTDVVAGDTLESIAARLATEIDKSNTYDAQVDGTEIAVSLQNGGGRFYVTGIGALETSTPGSLRVNSATFTNAPDEVFQQFWNSATVTLSGSVPTDVVSTWRITLGELDIEYQAAAGASLATIATQPAESRRHAWRLHGVRHGPGHRDPTHGRTDVYRRGDQVSPRPGNDDHRRTFLWPRCGERPGDTLRRTSDAAWQPYPGR